MVTRFYFHLVDGQNVIRDDLGALASDLADAHQGAAEIIEEFRSEQMGQHSQRTDWKLVVTDDTSEFALVLPLSP